MLKRKKPVLDEREMLEMYRVEHFGLWLMYALLCAVILVQMLLGAPLLQMAGELAVVIVTSIAMVIANVRHGIWDENSRPSMRGNALYSIGAGVCVCVLLAVIKGNIPAALAAGVCAGALCFAALTLLMQYMLKKQARAEKELDN
ncbi:MAG: hypothetical protein E7321_11235 [Clostridiales bacterium]|nr:hypothetical protein [Clostridiales bacterium]